VLLHERFAGVKTTGNMIIKTLRSRITTAKTVDGRLHNTEK
jgi:hypothetical protein